MIGLWGVQQAIYTALTAAPATYPVYDAAPQGHSAPYIVIGEFVNESDLELDSESGDASVTIHGWSRQAGKQQAHSLLAFVRGRLHREEIGGAWACYAEFEEVMEDPSSTAASRLYHAVARYRIRLN